MGRGINGQGSLDRSHYALFHRCISSLHRPFLCRGTNLFETARANLQTTCIREEHRRKILLQRFKYKFLEIKRDRNTRREIFKNLAKRFLIRVLYGTRFD